MQHLLCGAQAGAQRSVDSAPVPGDVGVLAGEEDGVVYRLGHDGGTMGGAGGRIAVRAERPGIALPIVHMPVT